jgi:hypothetical protein
VAAHPHRRVRQLSAPPRARSLGEVRFRLNAAPQSGGDRPHENSRAAKGREPPPWARVLPAGQGCIRRQGGAPRAGVQPDPPLTRTDPPPFSTKASGAGLHRPGNPAGAGLAPCIFAKSDLAFPLSVKPAGPQRALLPSEPHSRWSEESSRTGCFLEICGGRL